MSKSSVRFVALSGIITGLETAQILENIKDQCDTKKEDGAIKKDINWYRSHAKKEGLVDDQGFATDKGEKWVETGGKKPVDPEVQAKRDAKKADQEAKKAEREAKKEAQAKAKAEKAEAKKEVKAPAEKPAVKKTAAKKPAGKKVVSIKPAAIAAAEKAAQQEDEL